MKKIISLILIVVLSVLLCACSNDKTVDKQAKKSIDYEIVFEENFDGDKLNTEIWGYDTGFIRNNEPQYYTASREENLRVFDGNLIITAQAENYIADDGTTAKYTSAEITTANSFSFTYGKIEMRAKLPTSQSNAIWPAFWMMGTSAGWPMGGEIDILEMYGVNQNRYECNIHWSDKELHPDPNMYYEGYINMMQEPYNQRVSKELDEPLGNDWHTYGIEWTEEKMTFLFDDEEIGSFDITAESMSELHKPMYILLNMALTQEGDTTALDNGEKPQYLVDYVRVYQKKDDK